MTRIRLLRLLGMPLEEIRAVLQATDQEVVRMLLTRHQQQITDRMARDQQRQRFDNNLKIK